METVYIEPTTFDLIVVGTGLHQSVIAAAASAAGKSVLHLDPNSFYGSHFASLSLTDLASFLTSNSQNPNPNPNPNPNLNTNPNDSDFTYVDLSARAMYSGVEVFENTAIEDKLFCVDLGGPRVLFCADSAVDLLLKSSGNQYMEFKNIDACYIWDGGALKNVPDSRSAIFKDKMLDWREKNQLMKFFKLVQNHLDASNAEKIAEEDMETPFAEFLNRMMLPPNIKSIIMYAIAMADYDQESPQVNTIDVLKTREGIKRLALYNSSVGRFPNALGALIYPIYGQGELPQAFCRRAAVKGCLYVLRMPVAALLFDKVTETYKGVKLSSGQELFSQKLVLDPSFIVPSSKYNSSVDIFKNSSAILGPKNINRKVVRGICITKTPLKPDVSSCLVFFPPKSLYPNQVSTVRVLQLSSNIAVCPSGMFVLYISAMCGDAIEGKELLNAAVKSLFPVPRRSPVTISTEETGILEDIDTSLLWHAFYIQELSMASVGSISSTPMPDMNINYHDAVNETEKIYQMMYPNEDFFPKSIAPDLPADNDGSDIEKEPA